MMDPKSTKVMLISANVGSIFEDPEHMLKFWLQEFLRTVSNIEPGVFALHLQEVGGKNYEASMQHVNHFIKSLLGSESLQRYDRARVFLDEDFTAVDKFTALGNVYFIHESVEKAEIWNFQEFKFVPVEGKEVLSGNIENVATKEKAKFPQHFFPEFKWSRKGFMRTRWNINNTVFDLINIHLFHDASNIVAMQSSPSLYCGNRQQALMHTLQRFAHDKFEKVPLFIFGDFNFRLDTQFLVQSLTSKAKVHKVTGKKDQLTKVVYTDEENNGKILLSIETKAFDHFEKHSELFCNSWKWLHQFDKETLAFKDQLHEYDISFQPSYPFCEDLNDGISYMKTRCPSWCDRVLLSPAAKQLMLDDEKYRPSYDLIGKNICMGDHKPVSLFFHLRTGQGNSPVVCRNSSRSNTVSVNGQDVFDFLLDDVSIHDFATFEHEHLLLPEFYENINHKPYVFRTVSDPPLNHNNNNTLTPERKSFQVYAQRIKQYGMVLRKWPRRQRHHSSSSEESVDDCVFTRTTRLESERIIQSGTVSKRPLSDRSINSHTEEPSKQTDQKTGDSSQFYFQTANRPSSPLETEHASPLADVVIRPWQNWCCCCCTQ